MRPQCLFSNLALLEHGYSWHPENRDRIEQIVQSPLKEAIDLSICRRATFEELSEVHDPAYISHVLSLNGQEAKLDHETLLTSGSVDAALLSAGISLEVVERIVEGKIAWGFALVRPPGHHATRNRGMGYCIFNNIALAAKLALSKGLKRLLILDWDVHHGNGTQEIFYEDDRVLFIDIHQENLFPLDSGSSDERGRGPGLGYTLNIPLAAGCGEAEYLLAFEELVRPAALEFAPELILVSAGFDAHVSDPMGFMQLTSASFAKLSAKVHSLANEFCDGKVAFFLEGGYDPYYLADCIGELFMSSQNV